MKRFTCQRVINTEIDEVCLQRVRELGKKIIQGKRCRRTRAPERKGIEMSWLSRVFEKIDEANDDMAYEGKGKSLPDAEANPEDFANRSPLSRSYNLAADSEISLVEPDLNLSLNLDGGPLLIGESFYRNTTEYGKSVLIEVEPQTEE